MTIFEMPVIISLLLIRLEVDNCLRRGIPSPLLPSLPLSYLSLSFRPLLLIADRSADLTTMLHHTWSYQALVHDVLVREREGKREKMDDCRNWNRIE